MSRTMQRLMVLGEPSLMFAGKYASSLPVDGVCLSFYAGLSKRQALDYWITRHDHDGKTWWFAPGEEFWTLDLDEMGLCFRDAHKYSTSVDDSFKIWPAWLTGTVYMSPEFEQPPAGQGKPHIVFYITRRSVAMGRESPDRWQTQNNPKTTVFVTVEGGMSTNYNNWGQAGNVGPNGTVSNTNFVQQESGETSGVDWGALAHELAELRKAMRKADREDADSLEFAQSIGKVAEAEIAARDGNAQTVKACLKHAGKWAIDVATKIGASVAAKAIEDALRG